MTIIAIYGTANPKSSKGIIDICYLCLFLNFQLAWFIYGNTFHYTEQTMQCRKLNSSLNSLWILEMIIIATGYLFFFAYGMICCVFSCLCCSILGAAGSNRAQMDQMVARVPYANAISSLKRKNFKNVEEKAKNMDDCVICMSAFKDDDQIAELKCDERHYFHSACLEDWLKRKLECPLCKKPVNP